MEQWLDVYGGLPEIIGEMDIDLTRSEMCFVQYLPIFIPQYDPKSITEGIPCSLKWASILIDEAAGDYTGDSDLDSYMYLTVKRVYGTGNREGWHCDGFGTDDVNYIWYDSHPTEFFDGEMKLPKDHSESLRFMEENISDPDDKVTYPCNTLIRVTQKQIHRVNPEVFTGLRTFVKISFSDSKYNLKGNAHNYLLDYKWDMKDRKIERNDPIGD